MILNLNIFRNRCSPIYTEITIHKFASKWSLKFKKKKKQEVENPTSLPPWY